MQLPPFVKKYFWEIDPSKAHPKAHPEYYIKRVLELGDKKAFFWLKKMFGKKKIKEVVRKGALSPKSRNFWTRVLG